MVSVIIMNENIEIMNENIEQIQTDEPGGRPQVGAIRNILALLTRAEKWRSVLLLGVAIAMALIETLGVASVVPNRCDSDFTGQLPGRVIGCFYPSHNGILVDCLTVLC